MRFVDTNILLYAVGRVGERTGRTRRALELLDADDLALSVQVLQEFYWQATHPARPWDLSHEEAVGFIMSLERFPVQPLTLAVIHDAFDLAERFRIAYWDAAILAAARIAGCDTVYTEDLNDGQDYGGVRVVNPFAGD